NHGRMIVIQQESSRQAVREIGRILLPQPPESVDQPLMLWCRSATAFSTIPYIGLHSWPRSQRICFCYVGRVPIISIQVFLGPNPVLLPLKGCTRVYACRAAGYRVHKSKLSRPYLRT